MEENQDKIVINELKTFDKQVDAVLSGADTTSSHLEVLKVTPPLLRMVGVPNLPILMTAHHIKTITQESGRDSANYHGLGSELLKQLPELLSDPVIIMDSLTKDDSIVLVTQALDKERHPVIGAIKVNGAGRLDNKFINANILTSAYGKDNFQSFIKNNIKVGTVLYVDKEKSQALSVNLGIQFSDVMASLSFNTIIRKSKAFVNKLEQEKLGKSDEKQTHAEHDANLSAKLKENTKNNQEGKMDIPTTEEIEQARERARLLVQETGEPFVTIERSESAELNAGDVLSLSEADKKLAALDRVHYGGNYERIKLSIDYLKNGKADSYEDCLFDIGDEQQGLVSHIKEYWQFYLENKNWRKRLESQHSSDYVNFMYEEYERMANDVAPFLIRHVELSDMVTKAKSADMTAEEVEEVQTFVRQSRSEVNGTTVAQAASEEIHEKGIIGKITAAPEGEPAPVQREQLNYRDKVNKVRDEMVQTLLDYIEQNPQNWQAGWNNLTAPINGKTDKSYRGFNAIYLSLVSMQHGYSDPRWVTFNQAKELGASINKGEKSTPVVFFEFYDRLTKKAYDTRTTRDMTEEERAEYEKENVYAVLKYSSVFNAAQCSNFPERDLDALKMSEEERANQNELIETIISNSSAPVNYDGGNRAYYSPVTDSIHLPTIEAFDSMQDYYATALHEIAHSTGHASRLNRDLGGGFGSSSYAVEELRAELACVFMQIEQGIQLEGKHIENHAAYLNSWLSVVKEDKSVFFKATSDAQKIANYVEQNYLQSALTNELEQENEAQSEMPGEHKESSALDENIKQWYMTEYPKDELGSEIKDNLSFEELSSAIDNGANVYEVLGVSDSIVRERAFERLADIQGKTYGEIYDAWTTAGTQQEGEHKEEKNVSAQFSAEELDILRNSRQFHQAAETLDNQMGATISIVSELSNGAEDLSYEELGKYQEEAMRIFESEHEAEVLELLTSEEIQEALLEHRKAEEQRERTEEIEYRALKIVLNNVQNGEPIGEDITFQDIDYLINVESLAVKYGSDVKDGNIILTPKLETAFSNLREKYETGERTEENENRNDKTSLQNVSTKRNDNSSEDAKPATPARWMSVNLPEGSVGKQYGANTMIKMPEGEYSHYALFVPTKLVRTSNDKQQLLISSDFTYRLNNDGKRVELTGQELHDSLSGMQIGKEYKRVAPSRAYAKVLDNLVKNVPDELKNIPTWCCYRTKWDNDKGKKSKFIISPIDGKWASSKEPQRWVSFDDAIKYARENNCEGVSLLLDRKHGITCIDLDKCITNAQTGEMKERAAKLVGMLNGTYMERSTSGNGIHIFVKEDVLKNGTYRNTADTVVEDPRGDLEVFDDKRIISMTGDMMSETNELKRAGSAATVYLRKELGEKGKSLIRSTTASQNLPSGAKQSDGEVIQRIRASKSSADFSALYDSKVGLTGDKSKDDYKLANMLLYFGEGDTEQAFRLMRSAQTYRPEKSDSYYRHTIEKANCNLNGVYAKRPNPFAANGATSGTGNGRNGNGR